MQQMIEQAYERVFNLRRQLVIVRACEQQKMQIEIGRVTMVVARLLEIDAVGENLAVEFGEKNFFAERAPVARQSAPRSGGSQRTPADERPGGPRLHGGLPRAHDHRHPSGSGVGAREDCAASSSACRWTGRSSSTRRKRSWPESPRVIRPVTRGRSRRGAFRR